MLDRVACEPPYKNPKQISPQMFRTKIVHTSGIFFDFGGVVFFDFLGSKNIFNPCSHIEFNTQNPNPIFKITISFTKTPNKPKYFRKKRTFSKQIKKLKFYFVLCISSIIHIFIIFIFLYFYMFVFLYFYIFIYPELWCGLQKRRRLRGACHRTRSPVMVDPLSLRGRTDHTRVQGPWPMLPSSSIHSFSPIPLSFSL